MLLIIIVAAAIIIAITLVSVILLFICCMCHGSRLVRLSVCLHVWSLWCIAYMECTMLCLVYELLMDTCAHTLKLYKTQTQIMIIISLRIIENYKFCFIGALKEERKKNWEHLRELAPCDRLSTPYSWRGMALIGRQRRRK